MYSEGEQGIFLFVSLPEQVSNMKHTNLAQGPGKDF